MNRYLKLLTENIQLLTEIKKRKQCDTTIGVGYITNQHADMDRNVDKFVQLCRDWGTDYAQLRPSFGFFFDYKSISPKEWKNIFTELKKYETEDFKVYIDEKKFEKIHSGDTKRSYSRCHAQSFKSTTICATGAIYICCSLSGRPEGYIGNVKHESFSEIWNGEKRREALKKLDVKKCPALCVGDNLNEFLENFKNNQWKYILRDIPKIEKKSDVG